MSTLTIPLLCVALFCASPADAYCGYYDDNGNCGGGMSGGSIAGVALGILAVCLLVLACCCMGARRRRSYYASGGEGPWYPVAGRRVFPAAPIRDTEAGNRNFGQPQQPNWNVNTATPNAPPIPPPGPTYNKGFDAPPPPYQPKEPQYTPPPGEPPAARVRN